MVSMGGGGGVVAILMMEFSMCVSSIGRSCIRSDQIVQNPGKQDNVENRTWESENETIKIRGTADLIRMSFSIHSSDIMDYSHGDIMEMWSSLTGSGLDVDDYALAAKVLGGGLETLLYQIPRGLSLLSGVVYQLFEQSAVLYTYFYNTISSSQQYLIFETRKVNAFGLQESKSIKLSSLLIYCICLPACKTEKPSRRSQPTHLQHKHQSILQPSNRIRWSTSKSQSPSQS